jgi:DNA polymerase-3 subunit gamma/tau
MAPDTVREHLARVLEAEGVAAEPGALRLLGRAARGSMRDALSLTDQAIAYGGGALEEAPVRAMLGAVDAAHASRLIEAIAQRDAGAVLETVEALRSQGQSAAGTLDAMAALLQQMAIEQAVPGATGEEGEEARRLAPLLAPDDTQLIYSMCLQGRAELNLMSDEYGALTMVLLRPMAFAPEGSPRATPRPPAQPLRAPAPPMARASVPVPLPAAVPGPGGGRAAAPVAVATVAPVAPVVAPAVDRAAPPPTPSTSPGSAPVAPVASPVSASTLPGTLPDSPLAERWHGVCRQLAHAGAVSGLLRELAWQSGLRSCETLPDSEATVWRLQVESDSLRTDALGDRLAAAMTTVLGSPQRIELLAGTAPDSPARRDAAERERLQAEAERIVRNDPAVVSLLQQFPGARIVPGSIKPLVNPEGTPT